jgi:hypothetical protein
MPRTGHKRGVNDPPTTSAVAAAAGRARQPGQLGARGRWIEFRYDLATGQWSLQGGADEWRWRSEAVGRIELMTPEGQILERDVASAELVSCREEPADRGAARCFEVRRCWPDGLSACQRFIFWPDAPDFEAELSLRVPRNFPCALRSILPLARPNLTVPNLHLRRHAADRHSRPFSVLDLGWSAAEPARISALERDATVVATGLAALGNGDGFALTLGFLDASQAVGQYRFTGCEADEAGLDVGASFEAIDLAPRGATSGPLWLSVAQVEDALSGFVEAWRKRHRGQVRPSALIQWQPGRAVVPETAEVGILDRLAEATSWPGAQSLDVATIDPGWQSLPGDWIVNPLHFPHGLHALRDAIHSQDLRAGIRLSPLIVARSSEVFQVHPTWVVRLPTGDPAPVCKEEPEIFALDLTQPAVIDWLRDLARRIREDWGFDVVQVDCLEENIVSGWRANGLMSAIGAYRAGVTEFRDALGGRPLLAANAPLFASLDVVDGLLTTAEPLRRADPSPLLRACLARSGALIGPGPVSLELDSHTLDEVRGAATIACFGGGLVTLAGDLRGSTPEGTEILRACLPPFREGLVFPVNPFAPEGPCLFGCRVERSEDDYFLLIALNPAEVPVARVVPLSDLGLPAGRYHAFEFWTQTYLGILSDRITIERIPAGGCAVVGLRAVLNRPQIVGTSLHVSLGAVAIQAATFDSRACRLHLAVGAVGERQGTISIALPRGWAPGPLRGTGGALSVRQTFEQLVDVELRFRDVADLELEFWQNESPRS